MKHFLHIISVLAVISTSYTLHAQSCFADAGGDRHWCRNVDSVSMLPLGDSVIFLGGSPTVSGGTAPYTYKWSMEPINPWPGAYFYASDFLDDTTSPNPMLWATEGNTMVFYLRVEDSNNNVCFDTATITISLFALHLNNYYYTINEGDSIQLWRGPNVSPTEWPVDSLLWRPNHGIVGGDSTISTPWVKPTRDISYYNVVWDSKGCRQAGTPFYHITVNKMSTNSFGQRSDLKVFPTIISDNESIFVEVPALSQTNNYEFALFDINGKIFLSQSFNENTEIPINEAAKGVYTFRIMCDGSLIKTGKIIIQ